MAASPVKTSGPKSSSGVPGGRLGLGVGSRGGIPMVVLGSLCHDARMSLDQAEQGDPGVHPGESFLHPFRAVSETVREKQGAWYTNKYKG